MRVVIAICVALPMLVLAGCDTLFNSFIPKEEASIGQRFLEDVRTRKFEPVENAFDPAYRTAAMPAILEKMASLFPQDSPKSIKVVGSNTGIVGSQTTYNLTYEYEFPHSWTLANILLSKESDQAQIERIQIVPLSAALEQINAFRLAGKRPIHYIILFLALAIPIFTVVTAFICYRTPILKRKWLWIIFVLVGLGSITLNWTTGGFSWNLISFLVFGAGFSQVPYGPVLLQIAFPLGAVIFWLRRGSWISAHKSSLTQNF